MEYKLNFDTAGAGVISHLKSQNFDVPVTFDGEMPDLPSDITDLDTEDLMELFTQFTAFLNFISYQLALAEIQEKTLERKLDTATALATSNAASNGSKALAATIKAMALADPKVTEAAEHHAVAYNYRKLIQVMADNLNRNLVLVSRELTRRTSEGVSITRTRKFIT